MRLVLLLATTLLLACGDTEAVDCTDTPTGDDSGGGDTSKAGYGDGVCVSGEEWTGGNRESPLMNPGEACIACHTAEREGPSFAIAGTVFTNYDEPDDCNGLEGATVRITDAGGQTYEATSNSAGNFYLETRNSRIEYPYTAEVVYPDGSVAPMVGAQSSGDCNSCHTQDGASGAPGRISSAAGN